LIRSFARFFPRTHGSGVCAAQPGVLGSGVPWPRKGAA